MTQLMQKHIVDQVRRQQNKIIGQIYIFLAEQLPQRPWLEFIFTLA